MNEEYIMILYHGSNLVIKEPKLISSKRLLDFGMGFYLTSDLEQAKRWAVRTAKNRAEGQATVSVFEADEILFSKLNSLHFDKADREWLRYISANRTGAKVREDYDVIIGPVANDQAIRTVNNYLKGYFSEDIAIQLLLPQKLKDQYTFKTEKALTVLRFKEEIIL